MCITQRHREKKVPLPHGRVRGIEPGTEAMCPLVLKKPDLKVCPVPGSNVRTIRPDTIVEQSDECARVVCAGKHSIRPLEPKEI